MLKKIFLAMVILAAGVTLAMCTVSILAKKESPPPEIEQAPFYIITPSRTYYAVEIEETPSVVALRDFWSKESGKWVFYKQTIILSREAFGRIEVKRR